MILYRSFYAQTLMVLIIGPLHIAALHYKLYWHFVWLDSVVHFLGGVWAVLFCMWVAEQAGKRSRFPPLVAIACVLVIGTGWELFEFTIGFPRENNFIFDTAVDILMDVLGGLMGWMIGRRIAQSYE